MVIKQKQFFFAGVSAGLKKSGKKDLGLVFCPQGCIGAGVFTQNRYPSPNILYGRNLLPTKNIQAIIVNSGQSLAGTGKNGIIANQQIVSLTASTLNIKPNSVLTSSTGVIGVIPSLDKIKKAFPNLQNNLTPNCNDFAEAILTTDLKTKISSLSFGSKNKEYFVIGICKGSGMIAPNMATMLAYIFTNYPFESEKLQKIVNAITKQSFNCVSVDSDTSPSDSFFLFSSSNNKKPQTNIKIAIENIIFVAKDLAKQIAADGEGVQHLIQLDVRRAPSNKIAKSVLQNILNSPLVKCCINGEDANWGRILVALGNGLAEQKTKNFLPVIIKIQGTTVFYKDQPVDFEEKILKKKMQNFHVFLSVDLLIGKYNLTGWGCDLSKEYISINANYRT